MGHTTTIDGMATHPEQEPRPGATGDVARRRWWSSIRAVMRSRRLRVIGTRTLHALGVLAVVVLGCGVGTALAPPVRAQVGPLSVDVRAVPSLHPGVHLLMPPAGDVRFSTHVAPLALEATISEVDLDSARTLILSPARLRALQEEAPDDLLRAALEALALSTVSALLCSAALAGLAFRTDWRRNRQVAMTLIGILGLTTAASGLTFNSDRFAQPRFEGLLSRAPYVANQTSSLVDRLESYRSGLADIVQSITTLYGAGDDLPVLAGGSRDDLITVLHVSDLHLNPLGFDLTQRLARQFDADLVVDTGDITTWGTEVESAVLSRISDVKIPYVFVRGNHDSAGTQLAVARNPNAVVLDGRVAEVAGLVIAGLGDPRFTPDGEGPPPESTRPATPTPSPRGTSTAPSPSGPAPSTASQAIVAGEDPQLVEGRRLAETVREWNATNPGRPVSVAAFHEPAGSPAVDGSVPLMLSGHLHRRFVETLTGGTRLMVQGSTGGAGFDSLKPTAADHPVPLSASVLYIARSGSRAGRLLAYDDVTVGGFGLASASVKRTVVRQDEEAGLAPGQADTQESPTATSSIRPVSSSIRSVPLSTS
jgi:predicted MPP superfamily phosphohydrolase